MGGHASNTGSCHSFMGRLRVLLAEDQGDNRELAELVLGRSGFEVVSAATGKEMLDKLAADEFDVLILDIQLPDVDGLEVARSLRQDPRTAHMPIIGVTALAMLGDRERVLEAGCDDYISKPYDTRSLSTHVEQVVARTREKSPNGA